MAVMSGVGSSEVTITLPRDGSREPFGFRLRGGSDLKEAFIVQRVRSAFIDCLFYQHLESNIS